MSAAQGSVDCSVVGLEGWLRTWQTGDARVRGVIGY